MGGIFSSQDSQPGPVRSAQQAARSVPQHARYVAQPAESAPLQPSRSVQHMPHPVRPVQTPVQITPNASNALQEHKLKLNRLVGSLPQEGRGVYRALQATMSFAVEPHGVVHFESAFRKKLEESMGCGIELERIASGQWQCSCCVEEFVVSIRTEVLGATVGLEMPSSYSAINSPQR